MENDLSSRDNDMQLECAISDEDDVIFEEIECDPAASQLIEKHVLLKPAKGMQF